MERETQAKIEELSYANARSLIAKVNPDLVKVIDACNPSKKHKLFKLTYPYGAEILKRAEFFLPNKLGQLVSIKDQSIDNNIRNCLNYNFDSNPVMMVLNNSLELFLPLEDRTVPINNLVYPGGIFGAYRILTRQQLSHQPIFIWDMTAGARSIFMLAKISDAEKHKKLRRNFELTMDKPKSLMDHWKVFREIANHQDFPVNWETNVLAFSKEWFEYLDDPSWMPFNYYIYWKVWNGGDFWRNIFFWDIIFSLIQKELNFRPSAYIADTVKYLLTIGVGESPGFYPAMNDVVAPISGLQKIYSDIYNLKQAPVIMQPGVLSRAHKDRAVYYSLRFPSAMELGGKSRTRDNFTNDVFEIRSLLNQYIKNILSGKFNLQHTPFYEMLNSINYEYMHDDIDASGFIKIDTAIKTDNFFSAFKAHQNIQFPFNSSFFRGCIKISYKQ